MLDDEKRDSEDRYYTSMQYFFREKNTTSFSECYRFFESERKATGFITIQFLFRLVEGI